MTSDVIELLINDDVLEGIGEKDIQGVVPWKKLVNRLPTPLTTTCY
jgi:hypothetical protein